MDAKTLKDLRTLADSIYNLSTELSKIDNVLSNADDTVKRIVRSGDYYPFDKPIREIYRDILDWIPDVCTKIDMVIETDAILSELYSRNPCIASDVLDIASKKAYELHEDGEEYDDDSNWNPLEYLGDDWFSKGKPKTNII